MNNMTSNLISADPLFSELLEHAVAVCDEILAEAGDSQEELETSTVTLPADFVVNVLDCLIEYACVYEDFKADEIVGMLELQRSYQSRYGNRTVH